MIWRKKEKKGSPSSAYNIQYIETKMKKNNKNTRKRYIKKKKKEKKNMVP